MVSMQSASTSMHTAVSKPAHSSPKSKPPAPVKRLISVGFAIGDTRIGGNMAVRPPYVLSDEEGELTQPHTGRFCDDDIDIVHFDVVVVVSTKAVLSFMEELCSAKEHKFRGFSGVEQERDFVHNQITVLKSDIRPINRKANDHNLYRYGEDAVVELDLICEYIFDKSGYDEIKPKSVKETLGEEQQ